MRQCGVILYRVFLCAVILLGGINGHAPAIPGEIGGTLESLYASETFYSDYLDYIHALVTEYEDTGAISATVIGKSVQGRDIHDIIVGNSQGTTCITINATHHSREYINTILVLNQIEHILRLFRDNTSFQGLSVRQLLSKSQVHFIPLVDPDGLEAYNAYLKTGSLEEGFSKATIGIVNANNVNLNRNYDANFRAQTQNSGPAPFSEPETCALKKLHDNLAFDYSIAYHSEGNLIFWNYGQTGDLYDRTLEIARMLQKITEYALDMKPATQSQYIAGTADFGGYKDWLVTIGHAAATIETSRGSMKMGKVAWRAYDDVWLRNKNVPLALVSHFYRTRNRLVECDAVTANLCIDGVLYANEVVLYNNRSYIEKSQFDLLTSGADTDRTVSGMAGQRITMDVTDSSEYIMIDSIEYHLLRAIVDHDKYDISWDADSGTVHLDSLFRTTLSRSDLRAHFGNSLISRE